jgi:hypothetical protein
MGEMRNIYKTLVGKPEGKRSHGRYQTCNRSIRNMVRGCGLDSSSSGEDPVAGPYKHNNEMQRFYKKQEISGLDE